MNYYQSIDRESIQRMVENASALQMLWNALIPEQIDLTEITEWLTRYPAPVVERGIRTTAAARARKARAGFTMTLEHCKRYCATVCRNEKAEREAKQEPDGNVI
jgi:hypothetical protein